MNKNEIKNYLNEIKDYAVKQNPTDKPFIRQYLNDTADDLCRDIADYGLKGLISNKRMIELQNFIHEYVVKLHP